MKERDGGARSNGDGIADATVGNLVTFGGEGVRVRACVVASLLDVPSDIGCAACDPVGALRLAIVVVLSDEVTGVGEGNKLASR